MYNKYSSYRWKDRWTCTAYALQQQGIKARVFQATSTFPPIGTGIGVGSNAMKALIKLGIGEEIYNNGLYLMTQLFLNGRGKTLNYIDFSALQYLYGRSNITIPTRRFTPNFIQFSRFKLFIFK